MAMRHSSIVGQFRRRSRRRCGIPADAQVDRALRSGGKTGRSRLGSGSQALPRLCAASNNPLVPERDFRLARFAEQDPLTSPHP
jgi:hypothetical protein